MFSVYVCASFLPPQILYTTDCIYGHDFDECYDFDDEMRMMTVMVKMMIKMTMILSVRRHCHCPQRHYTCL